MYVKHTAQCSHRGASLHPFPSPSQSLTLGSAPAESPLLLVPPGLFSPHILKEAEIQIAWLFGKMAVSMSGPAFGK